MNHADRQGRKEKNMTKYSTYSTCTCVASTASSIQLIPGCIDRTGHMSRVSLTWLALLLPSSSLHSSKESSDSSSCREQRRRSQLFKLGDQVSQ